MKIKTWGILLEWFWLTCPVTGTFNCKSTQSYFLLSLSSDEDVVIVSATHTKMQ